MAHHQAMSLVALNSFLHGRVRQRRFQEIRIRSVEPLRRERVPMVRAPPIERCLLQVPAIPISGFGLNHERLTASPAFPH